jgi:hypothetical protein
MSNKVIDIFSLIGNLIHVTLIPFFGVPRGDVKIILY